MAKPVIRLYLDTVGDGTFATEITSVVISAMWQLGFAMPFDLVARDNEATITVNNSSRNFSPEYTSGAYYGYLLPGRGIKITSTYASVTRTMWLGWLSAIAPMPDVKGLRTCELRCSGWFERAQRKTSTIPLQLEKTADETIAVILDESDILPPGVTGRWLLGVSLLGTSTNLGAITDYFNALDTGDTTFAFAGDWDINTSVHEAITSMVQREAGRFWQARTGVLQFAPRTWFPTRTTIAATFADGMTRMDYVYGEDVRNIISTNYEPRTTGSAASTLSTLAASALIASNDYLDVEFYYTGVTGATIGATALIVPVANTDYTVNTLEDGSGVDLTANVTAAITVTNATTATVRYSNVGAAAYLQATSKLRGTPLTKYNQLTYTTSDTDSVLSYGQQAFLSPGVQDSLGDATTLGDYQLSLRKSPVGKVSSVQWAAWNTSQTVNLLTVTVGDKITLSEQQTQANGNWFVIGEVHNFSAEEYNIIWVLEDAGTIVYWSLGTAAQSEIGDTTILGPL